MDHLEQPCGTLTTTYAHCDHDILGFAATAFDKRMADQARAGHAERMAYGYGAAIDIQAFARNSKAIAAVDGLHGDAASEAYLSEIFGAQPWPGQRHMNVASVYEYGSRAGFWRPPRPFTAAGIPVPFYAVATALPRNPTPGAALQRAECSDARRAG